MKIISFLSYLSQHPVNSACYIILAIGYIVALLSIDNKYKKSKKLTHTQRAVLVALACWLGLWGPPQFLDPDSPSPISIIISIAVFALGIFLPVFIVLKTACRTNKEGR